MGTLCEGMKLLLTIRYGIHGNRASSIYWARLILNARMEVNVCLEVSLLMLV